MAGTWFSILEQSPQHGNTRQHDLDPGMVRDWVRSVGKAGAQAFPRSAASASAATADPASGRTLAAAEARIGELERLAGQLALENDFLKKALRRASSLAQKGSV